MPIIIVLVLSDFRTLLRPWYLIAKSKRGFLKSLYLAGSGLQSGKFSDTGLLLFNNLATSKGFYKYVDFPSHYKSALSAINIRTYISL